MKVRAYRSLIRVVLLFAVMPCEAQAQWVPTNGPSGVTTSLTFSGSTLLAGTAGGGVFVASGSYTSWSPANTGLADRDILSLASTVNEFGGEVVIAGTDGGGVYASWNHGAGWSAASTGLTSTTVRAVTGVRDPYFGFGMVLFAGTTGGVFRSNGGANISWWVPGGGTTPPVQALVSVPGGDENDGIGARDLIAGTDDGAFVSPDGVTWLSKSVGLSDPDVSVLAATTGPPFEWTLFAATPAGVFRSTSISGSWTAATDGLPGGSVRALLGVGSRVFAGTVANGVFLSTDQGESWAPVNTGLSNSSVTALASDGVDLFAATASGVFRRPLSELDPTTAVESSAARGAFVGVPHPNPFATSLAVAYRLDAVGPVRITVHDVQGRRVAEMFSGVRTAGEHQATWDGRNESGSAVGAGVYFLRVEAAGQVAKRRVVLSR